MTPFAYEPGSNIPQEVHSSPGEKSVAVLLAEIEKEIEETLKYQKVLEAKLHLLLPGGKSPEMGAVTRLSADQDAKASPLYCRLMEVRFKIGIISSTTQFLIYNVQI